MLVHVLVVCLDDRPVPPELLGKVSLCQHSRLVVECPTLPLEERPDKRIVVLHMAREHFASRISLAINHSCQGYRVPSAIRHSLSGQRCHGQGTAHT